MQVRFLSDANSNGWTLAVPEGLDPSLVAHSPGHGISLPWCLKVDLLNTESGRDYFQILEGSQKGIKASIKRRDASTSFLTAENLPKAVGMVRLSRVKQQLWYNAQGPYSAFSDLTNPVPVGVHDLEIPDFPHPDFYPVSNRAFRGPLPASGHDFAWLRDGPSVAAE